MRTKIGLERSQENEWKMVWKRKNIYTYIVDRGREFYNYFFRRVLRRYINSETKILELGCGTAMLVTSLANEVKQVVGLDISPDSLILSKENALKVGASNTKFVLGDCKNVQYSNEFNFVWSNGLIEHFDDPAEIVRQHYKVAKKGGTVLISVPYYYSYHKLWYLISRPKLFRWLWLWLDAEQIFFTKKMLHDIGKSLTPNYRVFFLHPAILGIVFLELRK